MKRTGLWLSIALWGMVTGCGSINPLPGVAPEPSPERHLDEETLSYLEADVHREVNRYRRVAGLPPLTWNRALSRQARRHSQQMAAGTVPFGREGFAERARAIAAAVPNVSAVENLAAYRGDEPTTETVLQWNRSPHNRENMMGDYDTTGIGAATDGRGRLYFTQIFVRRARSGRSPVASLSEGASLRALEEATNARVNRYRLSKGLPPLLLDPLVSREARSFSQKMAAKQAPFSHDGFDERVKAVGETRSLRSMGENLAMMKGYRDPVARAVEGWIDSPGHEKNMVGDYDVTGIGVARNRDGEYYFTQLFVKNR